MPTMSLLDRGPKLYRAGLSLQEIGDLFGVTREWVRRVLSEAGVEMRRRGPRTSKPTKRVRRSA